MEAEKPKREIKRKPKEEAKQPVVETKPVEQPAVETKQEKQSAVKTITSFNLGRLEATGIRNVNGVLIWNERLTAKRVAIDANKPVTITITQ